MSYEDPILRVIADLRVGLEQRAVYIGQLEAEVASLQEQLSAKNDKQAKAQPE